MRSGCIAHPSNEPLVMLRTSYLKICDGHHAAAMLLNDFEYWHDVRLRAIENEKRHAAADPDYQPNLEEWIYKSYEDLANDLIGLYGEKKIREALTTLVERGYIEVRQNPKNPYDRTKQFRFLRDTVQTALDGLGSIDPGSGLKQKSGPDPAKMRPRHGENAVSISTRRKCRLDTAKMPFLPYTEITNTESKASVPKPRVSSKGKERPLASLPWNEETRLIAKAMQPHAQAIGKEIDSDLCHVIMQTANHIIPAPYGARAAASLIYRTIETRYGERVAHRKPWPDSLGFWITVIEEDLGKDEAERGGTRSQKRIRPKYLEPQAHEPDPQSGRRGGGLQALAGMGQLLENLTKVER
jgi:hypothetical protein